MCTYRASGGVKRGREERVEHPRRYTVLLYGNKTKMYIARAKSSRYGYIAILREQ